MMESSLFQSLSGMFILSVSLLFLLYFLWRVFLKGKSRLVQLESILVVIALSTAWLSYELSDPRLATLLAIVMGVSLLLIGMIEIQKSLKG